MISRENRVLWDSWPLGQQFTFVGFVGPAFTKVNSEFYYAPPRTGREVPILIAANAISRGAMIEVRGKVEIRLDYGNRDTDD